MVSPNQPQGDAHAGTIVVLIDESGEMAAPVAGGTKSKAESVATAVNSMLNQLTSGPSVRTAIVGYGGGATELPPAQIRWAGPLHGRVFVDSAELAATPLTVEERIRRIPASAGTGVVSQETVQFPIWYAPQQSGIGSVTDAADLVNQVLQDAGSDSSGKPPIVIHLCGTLPSAAELQSQAVQNLLGRSFSCHLHLGGNERIPPTLYPSSAHHLPPGDVTALFDASSTLPEALTKTLQAAQIAVAPGARGLAYQAHMGDLIRFLMLAKAYAIAGSEAFGTAASPLPTAAEQTTVAFSPCSAQAEAFPNVTSQTWDRLAFIVMADRSLADSSSDAWLRRQEQVNDMLGRIAKRGAGDVDVGLILYGNQSVESGFSGPLSVKPFVPDVELANAALRVEQVTEKVSNGIGGLVEISRSRPIFLECEPTGPVQNMSPALATLSQWIQQFRQAREGERVLPLIMHVTGGAISPEDIATASSTLAELGELLVYCTVVPEQPQPATAYPANAEQIANPSLAALWEMASPLAGADRIAAKRSTISEASRGFVAAAKFDLLIDSIESLLIPTPEP